MKNKENVILLSLILGFIGVLVLVPGTKGTFGLLVGINIMLIVIALIVSVKKSYYMAPSYLLICLGFAIGIKIKYIYFISVGDSEIVNLFVDYFYTHYDLIVVGAILFIISIYIVFFQNRRIAEVAARFSLDALPGKQMSIEADYNSGKLSAEQARSKKETLQIQINLLGNMDGLASSLVTVSKLGGFISIVAVVVRSTIEMFRLGEGFLYYLKSYSLLMLPEFFIFQFIIMLLAISSWALVSHYLSGEYK